MSYVRDEAPWFTFVVHPRDVGDVDRWAASRVLRDRSTDEHDFLARVAALGPLLAGEILFGFAAPRGELVVVPQMPDAVLGPSGHRGIRAAVELAAARGAPVLGLGGLIAPATGAGQRLLRTLPPAMTLTTGNAYTAAVARRQVLQACGDLALGRTPRVAVLGATGSVGTPASHLLARDDVAVTLIGRSRRRLETVVRDLAERATLSSDLADLRHADLVLVLTNDESARLTPSMVAPGAVVIDVAQPQNVDRGQRRAFAARDVQVVEGGLVRIPGFRSTYDFGFTDPGVTFACLAETYLFAREGVRAHSVGRPTAEMALHVEGLARRHGVEPVPIEVGARLPAPPTAPPDHQPAHGPRPADARGSVQPVT